MVDKDRDNVDEFGDDWANPEESEAVHDVDEPYVDPPKDEGEDRQTKSDEKTRGAMSTDDPGADDIVDGDVYEAGEGTTDDPLFPEAEETSPGTSKRGKKGRKGKKRTRKGGGNGDDNKLKKSLMFVALVAAIGGAGYGYRHFHHHGVSQFTQSHHQTSASPSTASQAHHQVANHVARSKHSGSPLNAGHPVMGPHSTSHHVPPMPSNGRASGAPKAKTPANGSKPQGATQQQTSGSGMPPALRSSVPKLAKKEGTLLSAVGGIKDQLSTLETQLAHQRKHGVSKKDLHGIDSQIKTLKTTLAMVKGQLGKLSKQVKVGTAKHPVLYGYKLLNVVGHQAVIENMSTGNVATLQANGTIGGMTVYQVDPQQVVTNYGVFSISH